jgi:multidrug transporter EmrE-like cation transporter
MAVSAKPKSITLFNRLNLAATLVGIANIFVHYALLRNLAISNGASPAGPILGILFLIISYLIFWFFIYRRGSNIAKWLFVAVTVIFVAMIPFNLRGVVTVGVAYAVINGSAFVLQIAAAAMLFRRDAKAWLGQKGNHHISM